MPLSLVFRGGVVRFSFFLAAFGCQFFLVALFVVFGSPSGNKFLIIQKKRMGHGGCVLFAEPSII